MNIIPINFIKRCAFSALTMYFMSSIAFAQSKDLVVIDGGYTQKQTVLNSITAGVATLELGNTSNPWKVLREYLEQNESISTIHLFCEASYNTLQLGGKNYDGQLVAQEHELSMLEGLYRGENLQLLVYNCNLGSNQEGLELLEQLGNRSYFNIAVPTDCTSIFNVGLSFDHTTLDQPINASILQ